MTAANESQLQKTIASHRSEPTKNCISSLDRLTDLMENLALVTTQLARNYVGVRKSVEGATSGAKEKKDHGPTTKD